LEIDFTIQDKLIIASHLTGIYDVNRNTILEDDDFSLVSAWAMSIQKLGLQGILFHNNFSEKTCQLYQSKHLKFVKVEYDATFNPNVFRYFLYSQFLQKTNQYIKHVFFTDVTDVLVLSNPFIHPFYLGHLSSIFCGDEPINLANEWMHNHGEHFRIQIKDYANYESQFKAHPLLNCGIVGGTISVMQAFMLDLCAIHAQFNVNNTTGYTGDMGAFNYLIRTKYNELVKHGKPVNTVFKAYENESNCWFKHK
jgi:hypothetical protein